MGWRDADIPGVRSPPLPDADAPKLDGLAGKGLGIMRMVVFSEGRGLRVRIAMPCASRGTSSLRTSWREAGCQAETCLGCTQAIFAGVRGPPFRGEARPKTGRLAGRAPRGRERRFSRRGAVSASAWDGRASAKALHSDQIR
jgi:hypothetical protein